MMVGDVPEPFLQAEMTTMRMRYVEGGAVESHSCSFIWWT